MDHGSSITLLCCDLEHAATVVEPDGVFTGPRLVLHNISAMNYIAPICFVTLRCSAGHCHQTSVLGVFAGATVMAFLAGPPDRGRGCVLRRKPQKASLIPPAMTEISYTSLALGMQPSPLLPTHSDGTHANGNSSPITQVTGAWPLLLLCGSGQQHNFIQLIIRAQSARCSRHLKYQRATCTSVVNALIGSSFELGSYTYILCLH